MSLPYHWYRNAPADTYLAVALDPSSCYGYQYLRPGRKGTGHRQDFAGRQLTLPADLPLGVLYTVYVYYTRIGWLERTWMENTVPNGYKNHIHQVRNFTPGL